MLEIASLTVSISKMRHYTNFSDRPPLSQYPGSALGPWLRSQEIVSRNSWVIFMNHRTFKSLLQTLAANRFM